MINVRGHSWVLEVGREKGYLLHDSNPLGRVWESSIVGGCKMVECPICGGSVKLGEDTVQGELVACAECGTELEVTGVDPFTVAEAPKEEEDWGE